VAELPAVEPTMRASSMNVSATVVCGILIPCRVTTTAAFLHFDSVVVSTRSSH
jgi:hypothetical protein